MKRFRWNAWIFNIVLVVVLPLMSIVWTSSPATQAKSSDMQSAYRRYPNIVGTRLDDCALCHTSGSRLNGYGTAYSKLGFAGIENMDSDNDGVTNLAEIQALTFPGNAVDVPAPTATPTPEPTATNTPTATPVTTATPEPTATPTATPTPVWPPVRLSVGRIDPRFVLLWERGGGQETYGLPLTDAITDGTLTVQYFERARFEYDSKLAGSNLTTISVANLGVELGHKEPSQSPPSYIEATWYFTSTGHTIAEPFRTFWSTKGSILTFGYPIGKAFTENGIVKQYFERARMEHISSNEVQLGNLGEEAMKAKGVPAPAAMVVAPTTPTPPPVAAFTLPTTTPTSVATNGMNKIFLPIVVK